MRQSLKAAELDLLRIHQDKPHLLGRVLSDERTNQRMEEHRLAACDRSGYQYVRNVLEVGSDHPPVRRRADGERKGVVCLPIGFFGHGCLLCWFTLLLARFVPTAEKGGNKAFEGR